ncbi:MAG: 2-amino-4-hydroxy-6-hydroxymethyldihydropteridine diphosphokinase [Verrucomicrobiaceae bacterium]
MNFGIALGSNLGDRAENLRRGVELLRERVPGLVVRASAPVYETDPVDCAPGTQAFLNTVIEVEASLTPRELHAHLQAIEQALGRPVAREKNSPRSLDLDLLYAGDLISDDPALILPHPRLYQRRFVLQPLADIRPDLVLPGQSVPVSRLLSQLSEDPAGIRLFGS